MSDETMNDPWESLEGPATRTPRSQETRERTERPRTWNAGNILPEVQPRDGWAFKWVRLSDKGVEDKKNFSQRLYQGYEPVRVEDFPELAHEVRFSENKGLVERGGLVLCKIPQEVVDDRTRQIREKTEAKLESAESDYMRDPGEYAERLYKKRRDVVFGR